MWWNRNPGVVWGGVLVILGILFLLSNLNINIRLDLLWPVFIIAVGVWLIAARIGPGGRYADVDSAEPRDGIAKGTLDLSVGAGRVDVRSASLGDQLYRAHVEHAGPQPQVKLDRDSGTVRIATQFDWFMGARRFRLDTQISDSIPWDVKCSTGAIRAEFDLSTTQVTSFDCRTGASRIEIKLPAPKGVVPVRVDGGALRVDITRPAGAAMRVQSAGAALQLHADGSHQDGFGNREWRSTGFEGAADRYEVTVSGGALNVSVSQR
jgi:cell wall-active antibiotic response 4TMS protein YvqF